MLRALILMVFAGFLGVSVGNAQSQSDTLSTVMDPLSVEATLSSTTLDRATMSVSTLQRSTTDLISRRAATLDELTFTLPGIWVNNRENNALGERMTVRGMGWRSQFGLRGVQVILDDIPLTVADGQTILNMVDPAMVTSIELLRGPSATYWGNSSGGVLYMKTRLSADSPTLMLRSYAGSYKSMKHEVRWHDNLGGIRWNGYGSYYRTDGYRDYSEASLIRSGLSAGFDTGSRSSLEFRVSYSGMPNAQHPGYLMADAARNSPTDAAGFNVFMRAAKEFHQLMGSGSFIQSYDSGLLSISSHVIHRDLDNPLPGPYIFVDRWAGGTRTAYEFENLPFELQIGGELKWQRDDRDQFENDQGEPVGDETINQIDKVSSQSLFGKAVFRHSDLSLSIGLRGDRMSFSSEDFIGGESGTRIFTAFNPSIGLNYLLENTTLFTNFSSSFESPTTTEFKNRPGGGTGFNPNLDPEKTIGTEAGVRGYIESLRINYDFAIYSLFVRDQIVQESIDDGGVAVFSNGGNARHTGIEAQLRLTPTSRLSLELMASITASRFTGGEFEFEESVEGNAIPGVAPRRFGSAISYRFGDHTLSSDFEWISDYYANSENSVKNDSYALVNGRWTFAGLDFDGWRLQPFVSVNNLFDARYNSSVAINATNGRFFEPGSGRNYTGGISLLFQ